MQVTLDARLSLLTIEGDDSFYEIWDSGLFQAINSRIGTLLDDYEEEFVATNDLPAIIEVIGTDYLSANSKVVNEFSRRLRELCGIGVMLGMPLIFVL